MIAPHDSTRPPRLRRDIGGVRRLVIALGGNAILRRGDDGGIDTQFERADAAMAHVARLAAGGHRIVLTHGNGPVVGNIVLRNEAAREIVAPMPLYIADADSEGGIGLMLQMSLRNALDAIGCSRPVVSLVTQVVVDPADPAFEAPSKPIGPYYTSGEVERMREAEPGWTFAEANGSGWRRVVPSPRPKTIVEADIIDRQASAGDIVIAAGGGGVPVVRGADGRLRGVDAVVDKDWASALLACEIGADALIILMEADRVHTDWGGPDDRAIDVLSAQEARALLESGALDAGSIGPKVGAAADYAATTGRSAYVCRAEDIEDALAGEAGTRIAP